MSGAEGMRARRIALLVDCENMSPTGFPRLMGAIARHGDLTVRRAYGDWGSEQLKNWRELAQNHGLQPVQQFRNGKNAADIALVIDAMDLLHGRQVDGFCVVGGDSDYTRLALRLREAGSLVLIAGRANTSKCLRAACEIFFDTSVFGINAAPAADVSSTIALLPSQRQAEAVEPCAETRVVADKAPARAVEAPVQPKPIQIRDARPLLRQAMASGDWFTGSALGQALRALEPDFDASHYGHARLMALVLACDDLIEHRTDGTIAQVRLRGRAKDEARLRREIADLLRSSLAGGAWTSLSAAGQALRREAPGFDVKRYGHSQLQKLLLANETVVECRRDNKGTVSQVRLRSPAA